MLVIQARNAHAALPEACHKLLYDKVERNSRNGRVWQFRTPVTIWYKCPRERVLFHAARDANPFFHFFECLWMVAGMNDVATLARYTKGIAQFSDDGETFNGAYGHRWRNWHSPAQPHPRPAEYQDLIYGPDQLLRIVANLKENPEDRQQVLVMYDARHDPFIKTKDVPCNTHIYFQRNLTGHLDMTVSNRSNDLIWGALGANVVHFSFLQEVMAALIGCSVGGYWQVSSNMHVYEKHFPLVEVMAAKANQPPSSPMLGPYMMGKVEPRGMTRGEAVLLLRDAQLWMSGEPVNIRCHFIHNVADAIRKAHHAFRVLQAPDKYDIAQTHLEKCAAKDWALACHEWLERRRKKWLAKLT